MSCISGRRPDLTGNTPDCFGGVDFRSSKSSRLNSDRTLEPSEIDRITRIDAKFDLFEANQNQSD